MEKPKNLLEIQKVRLDSDRGGQVGKFLLAIAKITKMFFDFVFHTLR